LTEVFDTYWPKFEEKLAEIISEYSEEASQPSVRSDENILLELLETTRSFDRRIRSIEMSVSNKNSSYKSNIYSPNMMRKKIYEMLNSGVPEEIIFKELDNTGASPAFIEREILRFQDKDNIIDK